MKTLAILLALASTAFAEERPNVLFIAIDDLNDWIGCLGGHPQTKAPHLDRLAASGVLFRNAYCDAPSCHPKARPVSLPVGGPWQYRETDWAALDVTDEEYGGDGLGRSGSATSFRSPTRSLFPRLRHLSPPRAVVRPEEILRALPFGNPPTASGIQGG
jgi:hypothetical protein